MKRYLRVRSGRASVWVCCHFRRVLEALDALEDPSLLSAQRVDVALRCLIRPRWRLRLIPARQRVMLLQNILERFTYFPGGSGAARVMDLSQDFGYLYAAFLQYYGIDLGRRRLWLSWKQFCYLLLSLPADAKFSQIIAIRSAAIPVQDASNAGQVAALRRAKRFFSLERPSSDPMAGLAVLFHTFSRQE